MRSYTQDPATSIICGSTSVLSVRIAASGYAATLLTHYAHNQAEFLEPPSWASAKMGEFALTAHTSLPAGRPSEALSTGISKLRSRAARSQPAQA
jgi:hypothetical protein